MAKAAPAFYIRQGPAGAADARACVVMSRSRIALSRLDSLPLFATDGLLGAALLGPDRAQEWRQLAQMLEARGLPKVDQLMGGRYVRAVVAWFDHQYGLDRRADAPFAPDGIEDFDSWKTRKKNRPS